MASAELSRRVEGSSATRRCARWPRTSAASSTRHCSTLHEALLDADAFEDLPGKWQAAIVAAEQNRPKLRLVVGGN